MRGDHHVSTDSRNLADAYLRFGPGVPVPAEADRATAIWRGEGLPEREPEEVGLAARRRNQRWILPLTVLILVIAVVVYFLFGRDGTSVAVSGVTVSGSGTAVACGETERLTGTFSTNGAAGDITYQWERSDGTKSEQLRQAVTHGTRQVTVTLDWSFEGHGALDATATLRVLSPGSASAAATFAYSCLGP